MIEKGRLGVLSCFVTMGLVECLTIKAIIFLRALPALWGLVKFHIGGKVRARLLNR